MKQEVFIPTIDKYTGISLSTLKKEPIEITPCHNCKYDLDCKKNEIACKDFGYYIETGKIREKNRYPSRQIRLQIFPHERTQMEKALIKPEDIKKEQETINGLMMKALSAMDLFFEDKIDLEKVKVACVIYGLMLKARHL